MTATREEIAARVDALAHAHEGDEFVAAMARLGEEIGAEGRPVLQEVLLERAEDEEDFQRALRARVAEKGWTRRTLARFERLWRDHRTDAVAAAIEAGAGGKDGLEELTEDLRRDRGRAAIVLDELSRHSRGQVRAWVPGAAADLLGAGSRRLILSLTRDPDPEVRDLAVNALVGLGSDAAKAIVPDLRRRLHSEDVTERIAAMSALAEVGDRSALGVIEERAEIAELPEERRAAQEAARTLGAGDE